MAVSHELSPISPQPNPLPAEESPERAVESDPGLEFSPILQPEKRKLSAPLFTINEEELAATLGEPRTKAAKYFNDQAVGVQPHIDAIGQRVKSVSETIGKLRYTVTKYQSFGNYLEAISKH
ncbi:hypothetical protein A2Z00_03685 [Candidatus Gottesmanbacteria bacterium RBG_13_45_10]|uniref:Uncharacterized protein n=1 Tax=Candidatus Gottesmanbacteria bacterium RBG_13_45_10 TaxID=1798370 RepID=A0A1F5ZGT2_9BACT|nr:MAG: hypothetical protein A2Z00_03685 [Candidatus Gottesmanbacteria bacterium RBG_13_45_10]